MAHELTGTGVGGRRGRDEEQKHWGHSRVWTHVRTHEAQTQTHPQTTATPAAHPGLPLSLPVPCTVIVLIFILVEEAEALQGMFHCDAEAGSPAAGQALSLLG